MSNIFDAAFGALKEDEFEEKPVTIEEFVTSEDYLNLPPLSELQYQMIRAGSQIYTLDSLISLYGEEAGNKRYSQTCNECIYCLGKGSGKDYSSTIICAYVAYLLLCLKDPAKYYGKPSGDTIDILNIAVNADQARNVFFANFKKRIEGCPWFEGKFTATQNSMIFDKSIRVFSGHSERESFEGLNLFIAVLDEISAFALESNSGEQGKTADAIYKMYRASVDSRFPDFGKVLLLSFPRFENDYILQRYAAAVAEKEVTLKSKTLKLDPDLPDGIEGNEVEVRWEEDHIIKYKYPRLFALKRPTWEVNPIVNIDSPAMVRAAKEDMDDFLGRFAAMPSNKTSGYFKNHQAIDDAFVLQNGVDEDGIFLDKFQPQKGVKYFIHVDLAQKKDHCVVSMAHVEKWITIDIGHADYHEVHPVVVVDAIRWWTPTKDYTVDFADVRNFILALRRKGFDIKLCTFDRWSSFDTMNILESQGVNVDNLSVDKKHYDELLAMLYDKRVLGPKVDLLIDELKHLREFKRGTKTVIDHTSKSTKDFSDATTGAVFNAVRGTIRPVNSEVEVLTLKDLNKKLSIEEQAKPKSIGVIAPPKREIPGDIEDYLSSLKLL